MTLSGPSGRIGRVPTMSYSPVLRTRLGVAFTMGLLPRRLAPPSWDHHGAQVTMPAMCPSRITVFFEALSRLWQRPWIDSRWPLGQPKAANSDLREGNCDIRQ